MCMTLDETILYFYIPDLAREVTFELVVNAVKNEGSVNIYRIRADRIFINDKCYLQRV